MNYKCIKSSNGLTAGKLYEEQFTNPSPVNACVKNDDGETRYLPRIKYFIVEPTDEIFEDRKGREIEARLENLRVIRGFDL